MKWNEKVFLARTVAIAAIWASQHKSSALMKANSTELGTLSSSNLSMYPDISAESSAFLSLTQALGELNYTL